MSLLLWERQTGPKLILYKEAEMIAFRGFRDEDFETLAGSTWRSRDALGGLLSRRLGRPYRSWGVKRRLELHLARELHYDFNNPLPFAKLFVCSMKSELAFGFYIETPAKTQSDVQEYVHWRNFRDRLQENPAMREALVSAMDGHSLVMRDYYQKKKTGGALGCQFAFRQGRLQQYKSDSPGWQDVEVEYLIQRIAQLPEDKLVVLHIFDTIKKEQAIEMGNGVVFSILSVLRALVPVYEMTITEREI